MEAKNHLACVAGARKGKVEGKPKSGARAKRDAERRDGRGRGWGGGGERKRFPLSFSLAPRASRVSRAHNFPLSLPLSSACHAG